MRRPSARVSIGAETHFVRSIAASALERRDALAVRIVERALQLAVHAPAAVDHALRPLEILAPALQVPVRRRAVDQRAQVAGLVGDLDQLRAARARAGVL